MSIDLGSVIIKLEEDKFKIIKSKEDIMSNHVTYKNEAYVMVNPPGEIAQLKKSCPNKQIEIRSNGQTKTVSLGELRLDGE